MADKSKPSSAATTAHRKRPRGGAGNTQNAIERAYLGVMFQSLESSGRPGTPHRQFAESFQLIMTSHNSTTCTMQDPDLSSRHQVIHRHVNGLAVVTAGNILQGLNNNNNNNKITIKGITFRQTISSVATESAAQKRKLQAKMLQGKNVQGNKKKDQEVENENSLIVTPTTVLAQIQVEDNNDDDDTNTNHNDNPDHDKNKKPMVLDLYCGVWGTILELNTKLSFSLDLLNDDPFMDGYLAVILPTGPFPPKECLVTMPTSST